MSDERVRLPRLLQKALESDNNTLKERARLHPLSLSAELNLYPLSRATMVLPESDPDVQMHDFVEIYGQNGSLGIYRVVNISTTYKSQRQVQLNHALDVFNDAILPGEMTISGTVAHVLGQIIAGQTASLGNTPYWMLGTCDDTNQYSIDVRYTNAMQCLTDLAKAEEDYYFTFDFSCFPWRINFVARNDEVLTEFRLPRNVESCQVNLDDTDLCTKLYLSVDTTTTSQDGDTTTTTHEIHENPAGQAIYGVIAKTAGISAERTPNKAEWVQKYFERHGQPGVQITINGREINRLTGATLDEVHLGRICRVALPEYNDLFNERIVSAKYPDLLRNPSSVTLSLANKKQSAEGTFSNLSSRTSANESLSKQNSKSVQNNNTQNQYKWRVTDEHVTEQGTILHEAGLEIDAHGVWLFAKEEGVNTGLGAEFKVKADAIASEVSRATEEEGSLSSQIRQEADRISLVVTAGANPQIKPAAIVAAINSQTGQSTVKLSANIIDLSSDVTFGSNIRADGYITCSNLYVDDADISSYTIAGGRANTDTSGLTTIYYTDLNGVERELANFNIAATKKYKDDVAAAERTGWTNAIGTVRINNSSSGAGNKTVNLASGDSVTVYAQGKDNSGAAVYTTYGTVIVNAEAVTIDSVNGTQGTTWGTWYIPVTMTATASNGETGSNTINVDARDVYVAGYNAAPVNPTISQCYIPNGALNNVTVTAKSGGRYNVTGSVNIRVNFSDGTHTTYGPYTVSHYD